MIPRFVLSHTFFHDLLREDYTSPYEKSTLDFFHYLILRQAIIRPKEKVAITPLEIVDDIFKRLGYPYWFFPQTMPQIFLVMRDFIELSPLTFEISERISHEEAVILLAAVLSTDTNVVVISSSNKLFDFATRILLGKESLSWSESRKKEALNFEIFNTDQAMEFIKENEDNEQVVEYAKKLGIF